MAIPLQYAPFSSALDAGFWHKLSQQKLDVFGLDDSEKALHGFYLNSESIAVSGLEHCVFISQHFNLQLFTSERVIMADRYPTFVYNDKRSGL